jgi:ketosteroid isomerase-like protein
MSQENVEPRGVVRSRGNLALARQAYEAWNRGDLEWLLDHMTANFEFWPGLGFSDMDEVYRGKAGWRRFAETWREAWEDITVRVDRIEEVRDRIVSLLTFDGRGRASGVVVSLRVGQVATVRGGKLAKLVSTASWDEALEAAGLSE